MMKVRQATLLDMLIIAPLAANYAAEVKTHSEYPVILDYSLEQAAKTILMGGCFLIVFDNHKPVGFLWGFCCAMPWNPAKLAMDTLLYVEPDYRGSRAGYKLVMAWEAWAREQGATSVQLSVASGIHEERTASFYQRMGYTHIGTEYRKELT
ncbi:aminoglycoside acetyltransferase [Pseudomonas phage Njord]|uniref:Aminoglycoside acetyltransferase n=1 Tax=Pseudomonas phage Njord TaxID=2163985 RepID=A0A2S1GMN3_9CAUD|nr:acetyltransferase [Pseudomonas phage Njord]AWD90613.1 aminoglycoside acetyltransferase [Pseudomonas phage Njord]